MKANGHYKTHLTDTFEPKLIEYARQVIGESGIRGEWISVGWKPGLVLRGQRELSSVPVVVGLYM